jgi:NADPH2 dehydrogenase
MVALFQPLELRGMSVSNRIVVSPMCQYSAVDGAANSWHFIHLGGLALSGAGMLTIEATAVTPEGRITPGCLGLWDDATEAALKPIIAAVREHSSIKIALQIGHAGRKASSAVPWKGGELISLGEGGWVTLAPSAIPQKPGETAPQALDEAGLDRIRKAFVETTKRALRIGIDAIELHSAHGYLLHEFLSPISNQRTDAYGGSLENRMRFPLEIYEAVRAIVPQEKPVGVKVSGTDWVDGGWDLEQTVAFGLELKKRGVDWITASSGGISPAQKIPIGPNYQVPLAQGVKSRVEVPTTAVGLITEPEQAEEIIVSGKADLIALARGMLYDPRWGWHAAAKLGAQVDAPPQYWRAPPHGHKDLFQNTVYGAR